MPPPEWNDVQRRWAEAVSSPGWAARVSRALLRMASETPQHRGPRLVIDDVRERIDADRPTLDIVYRCGDGPRTGLQLDASVAPPVGGEEHDHAMWLASWLIAVELSEPRGQRVDETWVDGAGVVWRSGAASS